MTMDHKMIIVEYYEQFYAHTFHNLDKMDQLLGRQILLKPHKKKNG